MLSEFRPALAMIVALHAADGHCLSAGHDRNGADLLFPSQANGSLIERDGKVIGSGLIGQAFTDPGLFPRPPFRRRERL